MYRIFIVFLITAIGGLRSNAQNILSFIPKTAESVTVVKGNRIDETYHLKEVVKLETYQDFEDNFEENAEENWYGFNVLGRYNGISMGINSAAKYYSFRENNDSLNIYATIFEVKSKNELDKFIEKTVGEEKWKEKTNSGTFEYLINNEYAIAWNGQFFIYYGGRVQYYYVNRMMQDDNDYYLEELSEKERTERDVQREKIKEDLVKKDLQRLLSLNFEDAILSERKFMELLSKDYDSFIFTNNTFKNFGNSSKKSRYDSYDPYAYDDYEYVPEDITPNPLLEGNYTYHFWNFGKEELSSQTHLALNEDLFKYVKNLGKGKFNKNYSKYISSEEVMGYYSIAIDPKSTVEMLQALSFNFGNYIPGMRSSSNKIMTILGAIIDKKKALKILNGDALFVITDMKEVDVRYESYAYNKEDNVRERIIKTKKEKRPEFIFMSSSSYPAFVNKTLDMLVKDRRLVKMDKYYRIQTKTNKYGGGDVKEGAVDTYLAFVNGILLITNNEKTVSEYLDKGYPTDMQLGKDKFNEMVDDNMNVSWDIAGANQSTTSNDMVGLPSFAKGMFRTYDNMFDKFELNGMETEDNTVIFKGAYTVKKADDKNYGVLYLLDMLTGLTENPDMFSGDKY